MIFQFILILHNTLPLMLHNCFRSDKGYENSDVALFMLKKEELVEAATLRESRFTTHVSNDYGATYSISALGLSIICFGPFIYISLS